MLPRSVAVTELCNARFRTPAQDAAVFRMRPPATAPDSPMRHHNHAPESVATDQSVINMWPCAREIGHGTRRENDVADQARCNAADGAFAMLAVADQVKKILCLDPL